MATKTGRTGLIARKLGMTRLFNDDGSTVPVTVLHLDEVRVVAAPHRRRRTATTPCSSASATPSRRTSRSRKRGHFAKAGVEAPRKLVEFRVAADALVAPGHEAVGGAFRDGPEGRRHRHLRRARASPAA